MTYKVPSEIVIALSTGRSEFLDMLVSRLDAGESIPDDDVEDLVRFCVDLVRIRIDDSEVMRNLMVLVSQIRTDYKGLQGQLEKTTKGFEDLATLLREFDSAVRRDH